MAYLDALWSSAREHIRPQLTALSFLAWIEKLTPLTVQNSVLILEAATPDVQRTLNDFYTGILLDAAKKADDSITDVRLVLPSEREQFVKSSDNEPDHYALNPRYTFDTFVVGNSNHFAHAAAQAVAANPAGAYNPLLIYGGVGLGKTHLMQAIGHYVHEKNPFSHVMYVTSETFTNEIITAIQQNRTPEFRNRFRNIDLLLVDDVQFIAGKNTAQEEFFNTFNALYNANKQIIITSDRPPKEIALLEVRLRTRFEMGLIVDIQLPDFETRMAILRNRAKSEPFPVDDAVLSYIAENVQSNIRELEGCLNRVLAYAQLKRLPLNLGLAREALKGIITGPVRRKITPELIRQTVAEFFSVSVEGLMSQRRDREVAQPRMIAMYLCHSMLSMPYQRISNFFDRSDHSTAISACKKIGAQEESDPQFASLLEDIKKRMA